MIRNENPLCRWCLGEKLARVMSVAHLVTQDWRDEFMTRTALTRSGVWPVPESGVVGIVGMHFRESLCC
jgi:hypothetical protein